MADISPEETERNINTLTKQVEQLQKDCEAASQRGDIENLSILNMTLAHKNSNLSRKGKYAEYIARNADRAARRFRASKTLEYAKTGAVNKAELQAELDAEDNFTVASNALLLADQATDLAYRTDTFLKMSQTRVSLMKNDIR